MSNDKEINNMPVKYNVEKREVFGKPYFKVRLLDNSALKAVKSLLETSTIVNRCNITHNKKDDLTIYITSFYTIQEAETGISTLLNGYFDGKILSETTQQNSNECQSILSDHIDAQLLYTKAIHGINEGHDYRHALDDLRLALELLMKELFKNTKSIENQSDDLCGYLGKKHISTEIIANVKNDIQAIAKYFNEHEKHNNNIKTNEIDYIVNQVNNIINLLIDKA